MFLPFATSMRARRFLMNDWADKPAVIAEISLTHEEARRHGRSIARALFEEGVEHGGLVAVATSNRASFYTAFAGCFDDGLPVVVLDPAAATQELALLLKKAGPAALIADESILVGLADRKDIELPNITWRIAATEAGGNVAWPSLTDISSGEIGAAFIEVSALQLLDGCDMEHTHIAQRIERFRPIILQAQEGQFLHLNNHGLQFSSPSR